MKAPRMYQEPNESTCQLVAHIKYLENSWSSMNVTRTKYGFVNPVPSNGSGFEYVNLKREHQCRPSTYPSSRQTELWNEVQAALERMLGL